MDKPEDAKRFNEERLNSGSNTPIYRYIPAERYFELIEKHVNTLSHISMWEDPFEAFLMRAGMEYAERYGAQDFENAIYDKYKFFYGQCWTVCGEESDLRWRACGARGTVVRIKTTVRKLIDSVKCGGGETNNCGCSICAARPVRYAQTDDEFNGMIELGRLVEMLNATDERYMDMFFIKRHEFASEEEFRIIVDASEIGMDKDRDTDGRFLRYAFNPEETIEEVLVDPCMPRREYEQLICRTRHRYDSIKIEQSKLFRWPMLKEGDFAKIKPTSLEFQFWQMLQQQYPEDALHLRGRKIPKRTYWQISYERGMLFFFVFNRREARIVLRLENRKVSQCQITALRTAVTQNGQPLCGMEWLDMESGISHEIIHRYENGQVSLRDRDCWKTVCEWFCTEMPKFVQKVELAIGDNVENI